MKYTKLMRTLSSKNCSKIFSTKLNKAFDEAIENGSAELVDANNDLAIATVGNDIVVEDKINNEITKFENNPEVEGDMVMEPIEMEDDSEFCNARRYSRCRSRRFSDTEEPVASENYENTPAVGLDSDTHVIDTLPEVEVVVNEGVTNDEKSGTVPFSIKFRGVPRNKMYSITKSIKKAFCDESSSEEVVDAINNMANTVAEKVSEVVNNVVEEVKTESRRTRRAFSECNITEKTANDIVDAVANEVRNVVKEEVANVTNVANKVNDPEETKTESRRRRTRRYSDEENSTNEVNNGATNETNAKNNVAEVENMKNEIVNNVKEEVLDDVTDDLEKLVNEAAIEPAVNIPESNEAEKQESKKFSARNDNNELTRLLNVQF